MAMPVTRGLLLPARKVQALILCSAAAALVGCGSSSTPSTPPTPAPPISTAPSPTPTPAALACSPTPPPIYGMRLALLDGGSYRKRLSATPIVINEDEYCGRVGFDANQLYCETRMADDPLRAACDQAAVGRAVDSGRWGPTWTLDGAPCGPPGDQPGCENHPTDQFQVYVKGRGEAEACAAVEIPMQPPGSRCGSFVVP
jgi:hypothetical protein